MSAVLKPAAAPTPADFARGYAQRYGFHIVPLPPRTKRPLKTDWGNDATSDPAALSEYFTEHPDWNMGVALGPSRMCSFDVDDIEATRLIFEEFGWNLDALRAEFPTIQGSSKGLRVMFRVPEGVTLKYQKLTGPSRDDPKKRITVWELRAADHEQRQDVLPPSIHPDTGQPYQWLTKPNGHFPSPPDFLLALWNNWDALKPQLQAVCPWADPVQLPPRALRPQQPGTASVIDAFNSAHDIEATLTQYGYARHGRRYLSPHSGTGLPGVNVFPDDNRCWIHHASDPLCSNEKNQPVSPFDLYRYNEHGDDYSKAVKAAAEQLGMKYTRPSAPPAKETVDPDTGEITGYTGAPYITPEKARERAPETNPEPLDIFSEYRVPPITRGMLPDAIFNYAQECGELVGADPAMIAVPAIVACAAALHDGITIQPKRHETQWTESARLWCAIVGSPSVKKTPSIRRAIKRLRKIDAELSETNSKLSAAFQEQCEQYKRDKKIAEKTGDPITAPEKPAMKRMVVEDITIEALSEVLKDNDRGILCIQDELSGWFGSMDAYSGGKAGHKDRAAWLQAYNGGHRQVDRVMRGAVHIRNFSVSMIGGIQPDAIRKIAQDMPEDGLMQRFMIVIGRNMVEQDRIERTDLYQQFSALVDHLYAIEPSERAVTLTEEAHKVRESLTAMANEYIEYSSIPSGMKSHMGKWTGLFARLTLVFHAIDSYAKKTHPCNIKVSEETAQRVSSFMQEFLFPNSLNYYTDIIGAHTEIENARWIGGYILSRSLTEISNREITQVYNQWRPMDKWRRERVMQILEDAAWLTPITEPGRKPVAWTVNPLIHERFPHHAERARARRTPIRENLSKLQSGSADEVDFDSLRVSKDKQRD
jgi:hypothetical protein